MQNNLKAELIQKTGLTAIAFLLIGTMAIAQSAPTAPASQPGPAFTSKQTAQKKWLPSNFKLEPGKTDSGANNGQSNSSAAPSPVAAQAARESGKSGTNPLYESGHSERAKAATSGNGHPKPAGQVKGVPLKGGITPKM